MAKTYPLYKDYWPVAAQLIDHLSAGGIKTNREDEMKHYAKFAIDNKARYLEVEKQTKVPWPMLAVIHRREGDSNFNTYLGNGQSLSRVTTEVPEGRGPFSSFLAGCVDACAIDGLSAVQQSSDVWILGQQWSSWPIEKQLYFCTKFNGWGYWPDLGPYILGGTTAQKIGKYVRDHVYDPTVWDTQPGCMPILWMIGFLDPTVKFTRES